MSYLLKLVFHVLKYICNYTFEEVAIKYILNMIILNVISNNTLQLQL